LLFVANVTADRWFESVSALASIGACDVMVVAAQENAVQQ